MEVDQQRALREHIAFLAVDWRERQGQSFRASAPDEFAAMVTTAHIIHDEARLALHRWVDAARRAGLSWTDIGALIGISKQAAQQRFGGRADESEACDDIVERGGMTAFNEERELERAGAEGLELVGVGLLKLAFRQTDQCWEHRRVIALSQAAALRQVSGEGWRQAASWFPFHYLKRTSDAA